MLKVESLPNPIAVTIPPTSVIIPIVFPILPNNLRREKSSKYLQHGIPTIHATSNHLKIVQCCTYPSPPAPVLVALQIWPKHSGNNLFRKHNRNRCSPAITRFFCNKDSRSFPLRFVLSCTQVRQPPVSTAPTFPHVHYLCALGAIPPSSLSPIHTVLIEY